MQLERDRREAKEKLQDEIKQDAARLQHTNKSGLNSATELVNTNL